MQECGERSVWRRMQLKRDIIHEGIKKCIDFFSFLFSPPSSFRSDLERKHHVTVRFHSLDKIWSQKHLARADYDLLARYSSSDEASSNFLFRRTGIRHSQTRSPSVWAKWCMNRQQGTDGCLFQRPVCLSLSWVQLSYLGMKSSPWIKRDTNTSGHKKGRIQLIVAPHYIVFVYLCLF